jgi:pyridinium-3,5-bisthiocarboxylic acid mononucleotide nickel chelatase
VTRVLYVDAIGGLAGDMLLGALIDAGAGLDEIRDGLRTLAIAGLDLEVSITQRHGIGARRVRVVADPAPHVHRSWADIRGILDAAGLGERPLARAHAVFAALARAEGLVHATSPEEVRFHEVGAVDAIGDVCGIVLALESLGIEELVVSPLPVPRGIIDGGHGRLPLPAPATLELLRGAPVHGVELDVELVTPTGAAFVGALADGYGVLPPMRVEAIGYGAGARELESRPNVVRAIVGERIGDRRSWPEREVRLIETNLDDLPGQLVPDAVERCFAAGALDAWVTPVQMKSGRPGVVLSVLARPEDEHAVAEAILRETTTLGVRVSTVLRWELERVSRTLDVHGRPIRVKSGLFAGEIVNTWPEYGDCRRVAQETGTPVKVIWMAAVAASVGATNDG